MKKLAFLLALTLVLCAVLCACGEKKNDLETIGEPNDSRYAQSCLGDGEDGELYYDGFTVYTYRAPDGTETVYDVLAQK